MSLSHLPNSPCQAVWGSNFSSLSTLAQVQYPVTTRVTLLLSGDAWTALCLSTIDSLQNTSLIGFALGSTEESLVIISGFDSFQGVVTSRVILGGLSLSMFAPSPASCGVAAVGGGIVRQFLW